MHVPLDPDRIGSVPRTEAGPGGEAYTVRTVRGGEKSYRCPGCQQMVGPGTAHVVAWAQDGLFGADRAMADRRHWHPKCWSTRRQDGRY